MAKHYIEEFMTRKNKVTSIFYPILAFALWGTLFVASGYTANYLSVSTIGFFRFGIAIIPLYIVLKKHPSVHIDKKDYKYFFFIGLLGYFFNINFNTAGIKYAGASLSALVTMLNPFLISLLAAVILKEKLTKRKIVCLIMTVCGVYIVLLGNAAAGKLVGVLMVLLSVINWSVASILMRKMTAKYDSLVVTCYSMIISMCFHIPAFIIDQVMFSSFHLSWQTVLSLLYMGLVCTGLAMLLWNKSLAENDASTCSLFFPIQDIS
ncbi:MAG: DMT family transporter [Clostridiales bacterium]